MSTPAISARPRGLVALAVAALAFAIYLAYGPALDGEMVFDDVRAIVNNPAVRSAGHFHWFRADYLFGASRPLVDLTFALNYATSGLSVRAWHLTNVAAHVAMTLAVLGFCLWLLRRLDWPAPLPTALLTAALFGLHPLQSQAVAYICQRSEVLAALLCVGAVFLGHRALSPGASSSRALAYLGALACAVLGWEAKPSVAVIPALLLLVAVTFRREGDAAPRVLAAATLPFAAITVAFASRLLRTVHGTAHAGFDLPKLKVGLGPLEYLLTQARVILTYLRLLAWPSGQNVDWDFAPSTSLAEPRTALAVLLVTALLASAVWLLVWSFRAPRSEGRLLARLAGFGIAWFFLALAPTSSIVPIGEVIEEQRVYLASLGIFLPAAAAGVLLARRHLASARERTLAAAGAVALCLALGAVLHTRAEVWESAAALWADAVAGSPRKARPHMNLGHAVVLDDPARAIGEFRTALELAASDYTINLDELRQDLAGALLTLRKYDEGIALLEEVRSRTPRSPQLETNLAIAYLESGRLQQSEELARRAAEKFPDYAPVAHTLGQLALARGDFREAQRNFARAVSIDPDSDVSMASLASTEEKLGDRAAACTAWARYLRLPSASERARAHAEALGCGVQGHP